ncbi:prepilin-type N-terminal cleavage/methylation domain-containing protein [bacterium]|nr:prepilin-type N-terminal cleavage/methylation domain-containing protein [bacterium]
MYLEKKAFTLFELIVAISIVMILMMMTFAPYSYFQNKAKLKLSAREISQSFYEARNMAVS